MGHGLRLRTSRFELASLPVTGGVFWQTRQAIPIRRPGPKTMHRLHPNPLRLLATLSAAAALAACGGGGGGGADAPAASVQLAVSALPSSSGVYDTRSPISVQAQVQVNGSAAPDGTVVSFAMQGGSFTPAAPATRTGAATSTLTGTSPGVQTLQASATVNGVTASSSQTLILRPAPAALEILVPAYFLPVTNDGWSQMAAAAASTPAVRITAILNPSNGVFTTANASLVQATRELVNAGGSVVGYVYTRYGTGARPMSEIKTNIDRYLDLYGRGVISGIFLDEMASDTRQLEFYREIYNYIKGKDASLRVLGNPGMIPAEAFSSVADQLVTFEGTAAQYQNYDPRTNATWLYSLANTRQASLVHNADTCTAMQAMVRAAASGRYNAGSVYSTQLPFNAVTGVGNPWASLPTYWTSLVSTVRAVNAGTALPAC